MIPAASKFAARVRQLPQKLLGTPSGEKPVCRGIARQLCLHNNFWLPRRAGGELNEDKSL